MLVCFLGEKKNSLKSLRFFLRLQKHFEFGFWTFFHFQFGAWRDFFIQKFKTDSPSKNSRIWTSKEISWSDLKRFLAKRCQWPSLASGLPIITNFCVFVKHLAPVQNFPQKYRHQRHIPRVQLRQSDTIKPSETHFLKISKKK